MNKQLMVILEKAYEAAQKTGEFIIDEGTILIQQFLMWKIFEHSFYILLGIFFFIGLPLIFRRIAPYDEDGDNFLGKTTSWDSDEPQYLISSVVVGFSTVIGFIMVVCNILPLAKVIIAPNVYLLEFVLRQV